MSEIGFSEVTQLCSLLESEKSRNSKKEIVKRYITPLIEVSDIESILLFLSGVISFSDYESTIFFIDEKEIVSFLALFYTRSPEEIIRLKKESGDIGSLSAFLAESHHRILSSDDCYLSFRSVFSLLKEIATIRGKDSKKKKQNVLCDLCQNLDPQSMCFLIRFLLGRLRIGIYINTILDALYDITVDKKVIIDTVKYSKKFFRYIFSLRRDIGLFIQAIRENDLTVLSTVTPLCGSCIMPQAAEVYIKKKTELQDIASYFIQPKLDGFRLQVHITPDAIHFFSRNCLNVTKMFPDLYNDVACFFKKQKEVESVILDGELIAFDEESNRLLSFEATAQRKRVHNIVDNKELKRIKYIAFDILLLNNDSLLFYAYEKRLSMLKQLVFTPIVEYIQSQSVVSFDALEEEFIAKTEEGYEGVLIKSKTAPYEPGQRTKTWLKYKAVQKDSLEDSFDLVILGFNQAQGNRKSKHNIGSLLVGVYCETSDSFYSVAQVGSGGSSEEWKYIEILLQEKIISSEEDSVFINKKHRPDNLVIPHYIVSVKADTVTKSKDHTFGYSLRFPRFISLRLDKNKFQTSFYYTA